MCVSVSVLAVLGYVRNVDVDFWSQLANPEINTHTHIHTHTQTHTHTHTHTVESEARRRPLLESYVCVYRLKLLHAEAFQRIADEQ